MTSSVRPLAMAAALLASAALAAPPAAAEGAETSSAAAGGQAKSSKKAAQKAQTKAKAKPAPTRKVWTNADLEALRKDPSAQVLVLESKRVGSSRDVQMRSTSSVKPQDVVDRYAQLVKEADAKIAELEKEGLAGSNPYLRGLASQTGGPRAKDVIAADLKRWKDRRAAAETNLARATKLTGAKAVKPAAR